MGEPLIVEVTRGPAVESVHRVTVAVADAGGKLHLLRGNAARGIYPRSAVKPFQTLATLTTGAFERFGLGDEEIALHCASHNGESGHVEGVSRWLERIGLDESALECGPQTPFWAMQDMQRAHQAPAPRPLANNCSGKHAGFLTAARGLEVDTRDYIQPEHPVQQRIRALIAELADVDPAGLVSSTDMCRAPVHAMPLTAFATALARLADPADLDTDRAAAARRVIAAMRAHPWLVAGTNRPDTLLMQEAEFDGIAKCGAEGCYALALPGSGLGVAIKVDDGAERAAPVAAVAILQELGLLSSAAVQRLGSVARPQIRNWSGEVIGGIRPRAAG